MTKASLRDDLRRSLIHQPGAWRAPVIIFLVTSVLAVVLQPMLEGEVSSGLIFVLGITLVGANAGLVPAVISSVLASAFFNFFLADPVLTFRMSTGNDLAPPVIFTACAIVSGLLAGRLRDRTFLLGQTNLQLESLLETSRMLQAAPDVTAIEKALARTVPGRLGFQLSVFGVQQGKVHRLGTGDDRDGDLDLAERAVGEGIVRQGSRTAFRLDGSRTCVGALVVDNVNSVRVDPAFLEALASLAGLALERAMFASAVAEAEANARTEELKSALLSSVSHDLRTPLTAISASASSLIEYGNQLDAITSRHLLEGIVEECDRLNRFTANLLELSRLQAGGTAVNGQVLSVNDVVRSVVQRLRSRVGDREIRTSAFRSDILVHADTALFELALTNVIQNALLYSEADTPVLVHCDCERDDCVLTVTDQGRGIPQSEQARVFERFYRVKRTEASPQGSGLGLAIAKGFVEAFHGSIELISPVIGGKGTTVAIRLPIVQEAA
ncbi:sensor histidine kinase [Novosphingobium indicum]|nr:ATP-binding protein [Novosphingobium indicum]